MSDCGTCNGSGIAPDHSPQPDDEQPCPECVEIPQPVSGEVVGPYDGPVLPGVLWAAAEVHTYPCPTCGGNGCWVCCGTGERVDRP